VVPGNAPDLEGLVAAGVPGFKCFLVPSGVDEFPGVVEADLRIAMPVLSALGVPLLVHAELPGPIEAATKRVLAAAGAGTGPDLRSHAVYAATRPREAENEAIALMIRLCREYRVRTHIVHLSSSDAVMPLQHARAAQLPISVETCPHYLTFAAEEIPDGATEYKCAPPVRERENREQLWAALGAGRIQLVASDHSPSPPGLKRTAGDFLRAWGGIASLQVSLPATWTGACARGYSLDRLAEWLCRAPAQLAGLGRKGAIAAGCDGDLVVWDPDAEFTVHGSALYHRHPMTPYDGRLLRGIVLRTYLRGTRIYRRGQPMTVPTGRFLERSA
jgi:allantoinase